MKNRSRMKITATIMIVMAALFQGCTETLGSRDSNPECISFGVTTTRGTAVSGIPSGWTVQDYTP